MDTGDGGQSRPESKTLLLVLCRQRQNEVVKCESCTAVEILHKDH